MSHIRVFIVAAMLSRFMHADTDLMAFELWKVGCFGTSRLGIYIAFLCVCCILKPVSTSDKAFSIAFTVTRACMFPGKEPPPPLWLALPSQGMSVSRGPIKYCTFPIFDTLYMCRHFMTMCMLGLSYHCLWPSVSLFTHVFAMKAKVIV